MTTTCKPQVASPIQTGSSFLQSISDAVRVIDDEDGVTLLYLVSTAGVPLPVRQPVSKLAKTTSEYANAGGFLDLPGLYRALLTECPLPDTVAEEVAFRAGKNGTLALAHNPYLSEQMWAKVYRATAGIGRYALVTRRLLTQPQRELVVAAREKSPYVLPAVIHQLDADDLRRLAGITRGRALGMLEAELERRTEGEEAVQRSDGTGSSFLRSKVAGGWVSGDGSFQTADGVLASPVDDFSGRRITLSLTGAAAGDTDALAAALLERLGDGSTAKSVEAWATCAEMSTSWSGSIAELLDAVEGVLHTA